MVYNILQKIRATRVMIRINGTESELGFEINCLQKGMLCFRILWLIKDKMLRNVRIA